MKKDIESQCVGVTFLGELELATFSTTVDIHNLGITLSVDQKESNVKSMEMAIYPCLTGPFIFPADYKAVSPAYFLKATSEFHCDIKAYVQHFASLKSDEDCQDMKFLSANLNPLYKEGKPLYLFSEIKEATKLFSVGSHIGEVIVKESGLVITANSKGITVCLYRYMIDNIFPFKVYMLQKSLNNFG